MGGYRESQRRSIQAWRRALDFVERMLQPLSARGFQVNECPGLEPLPFDAYFHGKIIKTAWETALLAQAC